MSGCNARYEDHCGRVIYTSRLTNNICIWKCDEVRPHIASVGLKVDHVGHTENIQSGIWEEINSEEVWVTDNKCLWIYLRDVAIGHYEGNGGCEQISVTGNGEGEHSLSLCGHCTSIGYGVTSFKLYRVDIGGRLCESRPVNGLCSYFSINCITWIVRILWKVSDDCQCWARIVSNSNQLIWCRYGIRLQSNDVLTTNNILGHLERKWNCWGLSIIVVSVNYLWWGIEHI